VIEDGLRSQLPKSNTRPSCPLLTLAAVAPDTRECRRENPQGNWNSKHPLANMGISFFGAYPSDVQFAFVNKEGVRTVDAAEYLIGDGGSQQAAQTAVVKFAERVIDPPYECPRQ